MCAAVWRAAARARQNTTMTKTKPLHGRDIVPLTDLVPRHDVRGGAGRRVFGAESSTTPASNPKPEPKAKPSRRR